MSDSLPEQLFGTEFQSEQDRIMQVIDMLVLIDTGMIVSINAAGRAVVASNKSVGGKRVVYENVEILGIGNNKGCFMVDGTNCACLILAPRTPTPSVDTQEIALNAPVYDKCGVKALPITNCYDSQIRVSIDSAGSFHVISQEQYDITFQEQGFSYVDNTWAITLATGGKLYIHRQTATSGEYEYALDDSGLVESYTNPEETLYYERSINDTGVSFTISMGTPSDGDTKDEWDNPIKVRPNNYQLSFSQGVCTLKQVDDQGEELGSVVMNGSGELSISAPALSVSTSGDVSVTADGNASVTAKGNVSVNANGDDSTVNVTAKSTITLTGKQGSVEIS